MGIEFNPNIGKINNTQGIEKTGLTQKTENGAIISGNMNSEGMGISVESNPLITNLMKLFENVPEKPEFNTRQENLVIHGAIMAGADEELAEV